MSKADKECVTHWVCRKLLCRGEEQFRYLRGLRVRVKPDSRLKGRVRQIDTVSSRFTHQMTVLKFGS